jgi:signal transduction histidine kinase
VDSAEQRREVLRQASVALQGRVVTLWEVSRRDEVLPVLASVPDPSYDATILDLDSTLHRWGTSICQGRRWVGCWLVDAARWCVAPVRRQAPAPPPDGVERRSRERITLELAGLCLGLIDELPGTSRRRPEPEALVELSRQPSVIAHEVANPLTAALASLDFSLERVRGEATLEPGFRTGMLEDLASVSQGIDQAIEFLRSIQDRARGALARSERFDAAQVVRSCLVLERPLAMRRGVALQGTIGVGAVFFQGDPNALYQLLTNLIRNAVAASQERRLPVAVRLDQSGEALRLTVQDQGIGIPREHLEQIFELSFTTQQFGSGSGTGLAVVRQVAQEIFGGRVDVESVVGAGSTFTVTLPIPPQRTPG